MKTTNLLYYTVFDTGYDYVNLLLKSIKSLGEIRDFDILILTDLDTSQKIKPKLLDYNNVYYKIFDNIKDGVAASKVKVRIFEYENIDQYNTILFLDADTIIIKDLNIIFKQKWSDDILYTAYNKNVNVYNHKGSPYHSLNIIDDEVFEKIKQHNQIPFNAGQFLFNNTGKMKAHFENVVWFMENWPDKYFFEQVFMNHYFCVNLMTDCTKFDKYIKLIPSDSYEQPNDDQIVLHFIGPALNGEYKIVHIDNYFRINYSIFDN